MAGSKILRGDHAADVEGAQEPKTTGFGLYLASSDRYENQTLPSGFPSGSPEEALDCACRLYLDNPSDSPSYTRRTSETDH